MWNKLWVLGLGWACLYVMTFYVDACALVYFQFHPRSVDPSTTEVPRQKKLNVGVVREQVGVAFTYPNIHLSAWFLESSATAVRITEGLL